jgi:adenylate cyclase
MSDVAAAYLRGAWQGHEQRLALAQVCRIGRSEGNEVVLVNDSISRNHAMLYEAEPGVYYINDMGSSNGTFVNGARVAAPVQLRHGDAISIGPAEFHFEQEHAVAPNPARAFGSTSIVITEKTITVLVADIRDFTGMTQRVDPATLPLITGTLFRESGQALQERGAWAQKYIGDAVMAVWAHSGPPGTAEVLNVLEAACQVAEIAAGLQSRLGLKEPIRLGAGINTGLAVLGNVGSVAAADHTALGETVNRAFRLESMTRQIESDVVLGESTYRKISAAPALAALFQSHPMNLKGYATPVTAYAARFSELAPGLAAFQSAATERGGTGRGVGN